MNKVLIPILFALFIIFANTSCKKSSSDGGKPVFTGCELTKIVDSSVDLGILNKTDVSYDASGTIVGAITTGTTPLSSSIDYTNSNPIVRISGSATETDTLSLQGGKITAIVAHYFNTSPQYSRVSYFTYDSAGFLQTRKDYYSTGTSETFNYTWSNGDMISEISATQSNIYTYDTSVTSQDGDWLREHQIVMLGLGRAYINNKHALHSYQHNVDAPTYFFYQKDANNHIVTCNSYTGSSFEVYTYSYYCTQ